MDIRKDFFTERVLREVVESPRLEVVRKQRGGTWEQGFVVNTVVLGCQLDSTILEAISNLNNSMIL